MSSEVWNSEMDRIWLRHDKVYWMKLKLIDESEEKVLVRTRELYYVGTEPYIQIEAHKSLGSGVPLLDLVEIMESIEQ